MTIQIRVFVAIPVLTILLAACEPQQAPAIQGSAPAVTVVTLKAQPVTLTRQLPGRTNAFVVAEVRPQVTGIVKERLFTEGSLVEAGQPLYQLDDATYRADYNSAMALLARAGGFGHCALQCGARGKTDWIQGDQRAGTGQCEGAGTSG